MVQEENVIVKNLTQIRNYKKLTLDEVARKMKLSSATISRIESEKIALSYQHLALYAKAYDMSVIDILTYPETYLPVKQQTLRKVLVEFEVTEEEFNKMGIKEKINRNKSN